MEKAIEDFLKGFAEIAAQFEEEYKEEKDKKPAEKEKVDESGRD